MDGFVSSHITANGATDGPYTMSYLDRNDIRSTTPGRKLHHLRWLPLLAARPDLAEPAVPDERLDRPGGRAAAARSSPTSTTDPVRLEVLPGGADRGRCELEGVPGGRQLRAATCSSSFNSFQTAPVSSPLYQNGLRSYQDGQFEWDALHDRLPTVSWIIPTSYQSEHRTTPRRPGRTSWPARSTRSRPTPTCGTAPSSSSTTTRTMASSTTCRRPPRRPARRVSTSPTLPHRAPTASPPSAAVPVPR